MSIVEYFKYISVIKPKTTTITEKLISSIEIGQLLNEEQSIKNNNLHIINILTIHQNIFIIVAVIIIFAIICFASVVVYCMKDVSLDTILINIY
jgi:hypothetical protein